MKIQRIQLLHLYLSPGHNYFGHHEQPPGSHPIVEAGELECVAGRGVAGDRFFDYKKAYKGQITFFEHEVFERLRNSMGAVGKAPSVFRRNVITRGVDLNSLIGETFQIQGVTFAGLEECKPCHWMDLAFAPGAHEALKNHGGLRARILASGKLAVTGEETTPLVVGENGP